MQCLAERRMFADVDCSVFSHPKPMTMALSVLVVIEMSNAINRYWPMKPCLAVSSPNQLTFFVQTHHMQCLAEHPAFAGVDCDVFSHPKPMTMALSVLVVIEMSNAVNRYCPIKPHVTVRNSDQLRFFPNLCTLSKLFVP